VVYFNNYLCDPKRPQLPEHPSSRPGAVLGGSHPSGLPLPTPMGGQGLINRPPLWPNSIKKKQSLKSKFRFFFLFFLVSAPAHPGPQNHYYNNQYHQPRQPRPPYMYAGSGGPMNRPP